MKKFVLLFTGFILIIPFYHIQAQELLLNSKITGVCYAGNKVNRIYIPPPKEFRDSKGSKGGGSITVYYSGFSDQAMTAMDYAISILKSILPPDTKLTINASWKKISTSGVLGNSRITGFAAGWGINAEKPFAFYPVALAEKIAGKSLNEDMEGDIELILNSSVSWYLGTDGNTPTQRYDLVTVVLHEICHGLGFFDSMDTDDNGTVGFYGVGTIPVIYDTFIENLTEKRLTDTLIFTNYTAALLKEFTGGQLYFDGPLVNKYLNGTRARIYAPSTWDAGSSISHLDEVRTLPPHTLMTPFIDLGEAIHDPGQLTFSILGELGWINTRIIHNEPADTEEYLSEIELLTGIKSDTLYNRNRIGLVYSLNNFLTADTLYMIPQSTDDSYKQTISIPSYDIKLDYYMFAEDHFNRLYRSPSLADKRPFSIYIGTDTVKPVIIHSPEEFYFEKVNSIKLEATVTDNLGIDTVYVEYRVNQGASKFIGLTDGAEDLYSKLLYTKPEALTGGDSIQYRIVAIDKAAVPNIRIMPETGYYTINIETTNSVVTDYSTDFTNDPDDFYFSGFKIAKPLYFSSLALHTEHPYKSPDEDDKTFNFFAVLRHPVVFDPTGMVLTFRELVLVEPGEEGSRFGSTDFYDYVVVEGSKDFGTTWFSLAGGYDSRIIPSWETAYNSSIDGQNSTYVGKESMLVQRVIYPRVSDKISSGDSLLVRFRLFSDPYANGWGWVIDDLQINPLADPVEKIATVPVKIYPNPGNGLITLERESTGDWQPLRFTVYNSVGLCLIKNNLVIDPITQIDISGYSSGLYIIVIDQGGEITTIKYSLIK